EVLRGHRPLQAADLDAQEGKALGGIHHRLHPVSPDIQDLGPVHPEVDQGLTDGEPGEDMAPGPGGGDQEGHRFASAPAWAMLTRIPSDAMDTTKAVIPYDTNGRAMPVMGRTPRTPPMLTSAWKEIHAVMPA